MTLEQAIAITKPHTDKITAEARAAAMLKALKCAEGYLLNAKIDLETGATKRTALNTIEGGLRMVRDAITAAA